MSEGIFNTITFFFILLIIATILDRLMEILTIFFEWLWPRSPFLQECWNSLWEALAEKLQEIDPRLVQEENLREIKRNSRAIFLQLVIHVAASALGVFICFRLKLGMLYGMDLIKSSSGWDYFLTGLLVGAGSEPIHSLFRIAQARKQKRKLEAQTARIK